MFGVQGPSQPDHISNGSGTFVVLADICCSFSINHRHIGQNVKAFGQNALCARIMDDDNLIRKVEAVDSIQKSSSISMAWITCYNNLPKQGKKNDKIILF